MAGGSLVFVQVVEVEVEQPRGFVGILFVEWHEAIAEVEGYGCGVGIDGDEAAAGLVVGCEVALDEIEQRTSDIHTFCRSMYGQTTYFGCGITLQPLVVVEATAEAVVLCLAVEVGNGYAVVGEAEERFDMFIGQVVSLFQHISHGQFLLAVKRAFVEDKVI